MIKNNQKRLNRIQVLVDALIIVISYILSWWLKFRSGLLPLFGEWLSFKQYMFALVGVIPGYLILYYCFHLYRPKRLSGRRTEIAQIIKANTIGLLAFILVLYLLKLNTFSRQMLFFFYTVNVYLEIITRNLIRFTLNKIRRQGFNLKHILLVGYSRAAEAYIDRILANPQWGYNIHGILDDTVKPGTLYKGISVLGPTNDLLTILPENSLDEIAITLGLNEYSKLEHIVEICEKSGVHTKFIPDYNSILPTRPYTEDVLGLPVINIRNVPLNNMVNQLLKRCVDIFGATVAIILFSPIMLIVSILIKITSPGPLIFKQERIGLHNKSFKMYKFRSMEVQPEREGKDCLYNEK